MFSINRLGKRGLLLLLSSALCLSLMTTWFAHTHLDRPSQYSHLRPRIELTYFQEFLGLSRSQCPYYNQTSKVDAQQYKSDLAYRKFCDTVYQRVKPRLRDDRHYYIWTVMRPGSIRGWPFVSKPYIYTIEFSEWSPGVERNFYITGIEIAADGEGLIRWGHWV